MSRTLPVFTAETTRGTFRFRLPRADGDAPATTQVGRRWVETDCTANDAQAVSRALDMPPAGAASYLLGASFFDDFAPSDVLAVRGPSRSFPRTPKVYYAAGPSHD
jgi:hypothetical protein